MSNVRRWYTYIVSFISLQAVVWAIIALLRNLIIFGIDPLAVAFQLSVIIIGLPVFLVHWLWGQRLVAKSEEERGATLRRVYLYGTLAVFLVPFLANAFDLIRRLLGKTNNLQSYGYNRLSIGNTVVFHLIALIILGVVWFYHYRVVADDSKIVPEMGSSATVRRFYVLGFSAGGLTMTTMAIIQLIRWIMLRIGSSVVRSGGLSVTTANEITRLVIGLLLWIIFWLWAQRLFHGPSEEEHVSALRKFYLYVAVFIGTIGVVGYTTGILAGLFRRLVDIPSGGDIRYPLPVIIGMGLVWAYHSFVLRDDARQAGTTQRQAGIRRLYVYLVAAIGLSALLVGLSGDISVILRALDSSFGSGFKEEFAWFTAAIIAGLPVWIIPWRKVQAEAAETGPNGVESRHSVVRKIYLYFFLFLAIMTVLSSLVYILFRIISLILGEDPPTLTELGHAISFCLIALGILLYHGSILRADRKQASLEQTNLLEELRVLLINTDQNILGSPLIEELKQQIPGISLETISLDTTSSMSEAVDIPENIEAQIVKAGLIIGPWTIALSGGTDDLAGDEIAKAVGNSPAHKLLIPFQSDGWDWVGVDRMDSGDILRQTVRAVKQILVGEEVKARGSLSVGAIVGIIIGVLILFFSIASQLLWYFI